MTVTYLLYATGWALVRRLPERAAYGLFRLLADLAWWRRGAPVARLEANLRRVLGPDVAPEQLRRGSRHGLRSYLRYWCDVFRLPDWDDARTVGTVRCVGEHRLREPLAAGRGVVAPLPHMGNWDHAGAWACRTGAPVTTVAERLRPERLFARFLAYRQALGMEILPLTGGPAPVMDVLVDRVRAGALVPLLADRDLGRSGVPVTLFGETTRFPPGPALLALRTGAPLLPVTLHADGRVLVLTFHPYVDPPAAGSVREKVTAMTQGVADTFARAIREHPEDWHMLQPLWVADLPAARQEALR